MVDGGRDDKGRIMRRGRRIKMGAGHMDGGRVRGGEGGEQGRRRREEQGVG